MMNKPVPAPKLPTETWQRIRPGDHLGACDGPRFKERKEGAGAAGQAAA